jgi:hypothetical protein
MTEAVGTEIHTTRTLDHRNNDPDLPPPSRPATTS